MLKRRYRLPAGIKLARPSSYKSQSMRVMIAKNQLRVSRFGFVVSRKIDKRSVVRNRIKRVMRSCIQDLLQKIVDKYDMLFIVQKNIVDQKRDALYEEIENLLKEKRLLNEK